ncbi:MAG: hypothetical protein OXT70_01255 [Chloroflexota bacterium]|nr:hypothetical protein [Chloroflexota bacterium]
MEKNTTPNTTTDTGTLDVCYGCLSVYDRADYTVCCSTDSGHRAQARREQEQANGDYAARIAAHLAGPDTTAECGMCGVEIDADEAYCSTSCERADSDA